MKTAPLIVFCGPTIAEHEVKAIVPEAICLPPVQCGNLLNIMPVKPKAVVIIDGYFQGCASLWHKEILWVLSQGVKVYGAASMGALRAAELYEYGMHGAGRIFNDYLTGVIDGDDEVAVIHDERYQCQTIPLINMRYDLEQRVIDDELKQEKATQLKTIMKSLAYSERRMSTIIKHMKKMDACLWAEKELKEYFKNQLRDYKKQDAYQLLEQLKIKNELLSCQVKPTQIMTQSLTTLLYQSVSQPCFLYHENFSLPVKITFASRLLGPTYRLVKGLSRLLSIVTMIKNPAQFDYGHTDGVFNLVNRLTQLKHQSLPGYHQYQDTLAQCWEKLHDTIEGVLLPPDKFINYARLLLPGAEVDTQLYRWIGLAWQYLYEAVMQEIKCINQDELAAFSSQFRQQRGLSTQNELIDFMHKEHLTLANYSEFIQAVFIYNWVVVRLNVDIVCDKIVRSPWWFLFVLLISGDYERLIDNLYQSSSQRGVWVADQLKDIDQATLSHHYDIDNRHLFIQTVLTMAVE